MLMAKYNHFGRHVEKWRKSCSGELFSISIIIMLDSLISKTYGLDTRMDSLGCMVPKI